METYIISETRVQRGLIAKFLEVNGEAMKRESDTCNVR